MTKISLIRSLLLILTLILFTGCDDDSETATPLGVDAINLIFVVSPDLANDPLGDINLTTANLNKQGLQRSLLMGSYLKEHVLGTTNPTSISVLEPMTHLQTVNNYPDMAAIGFIQQYALLNQITLLGTTANSFSLNTAYAPGSTPIGVVEPDPYIPGCQGLDFDDANGNNLALVTGIIQANAPGFYVFSAPWETTSALLANINRIHGYNLDLPKTYKGPNHVYMISILPSGDAILLTFDSKLTPPATYPVLPSPVNACPCDQQDPFNITRIGGVNGVVIPANSNVNQTVYLIRHAEAHPVDTFENGNYVGAGQWRALALPDALDGKIDPDQVYSIDPAQSFSYANYSFSYVRPSLTVLPYVIANNLPYKLVADFYIGSATDTVEAKAASDFFFTGGNFTNQTLLVAWEHEHYPTLITELLKSYAGNDPPPTLTWDQTDYDTIWTVTLDAQGNLTVDNALCEGIDSASLPATAPQF
ncbi:MAG: hypothetical protein JEZ02_02820 [Desulfatibacillum sp.]|nr:hypothetical protein [Desulfatibacillum sp.]